MLHQGRLRDRSGRKLHRGAVVSHLSAAREWELEVWGAPDWDWVTLPLGVRARGMSSLQVSWASLDPDEITLTADGRQLTTLIRTVLDCARVLPFYDAVAMMDQALRLRRLDKQELLRAASRRSGRGSARMRAVVRAASPHAHSRQESFGRLGLRIAGLPFEPQFRIVDDPWWHRFDLGAAWAKTVVDQQSQEHHTHWADRLKDMAHLQELNRAKGWSLVLTGPRDAMPSPSLLVRKVLEVVVWKPGPRCYRLRKAWVDRSGDLSFPSRADGRPGWDDSGYRGWPK